MPFQTTMNVTQAVGVEGDFATANPRASLPSVPGGYVAGAGGLTVGRFAWADTATGTILLNAGSGVPSCFIHRNFQVAAYNYTGVIIGEGSMVIPAGFGVGDAFTGGDFFVKNAGSGATTIGMKAFASLTTGQVQFAATGSTIAGWIETKWYALSVNLTGELVIMGSSAPD